MSWDADYSAQTVDGPLVNIGSWNYTHNMNGAINQALGLQPAGSTYNTARAVLFGEAPSWWRLLDGMSGSDGQALLARILRAFAADQDRFRAMDPDNGWGSLETLGPVLAEMLAACTTFPVGVWRCSG